MLVVGHRGLQHSEGVQKRGQHRLSLPARLHPDLDIFTSYRDVCVLESCLQLRSDAECGARVIAIVQKDQELDVSVKRPLELDVVLDGVWEHLFDRFDEVVGFLCGELQLGVGPVGGPTRGS